MKRNPVWIGLYGLVALMALVSGSHVMTSTSSGDWRARTAPTDAWITRSVVVFAVSLGALLLATPRARD